jgi:preprotein translocase subunit SecY
MSNQGNMSDLWKRLRFVLFAILAYRIGTHIPIPGINPRFKLNDFLQIMATEQYFKCSTCFLVAH